MWLQILAFHIQEWRFTRLVFTVRKCIRQNIIDSQLGLLARWYKQKHWL